MIDARQIPSLRKLKHQKILSLSASKISCPSCDSTMREFSYRSVEIDICPTCKSVWLDPGEEKILEKRRQKKEESKWYDHLDPISVFPGRSSSRSSSSCSGDDSGILDFLGDAIGNLFDGI
ncbi:zf-TFIIB domain-containing protein [Motiliproteus sp. SC1-56]|uniref:TFIIB-type zinc ribbon-containing protein n=1 Tax=Motiliproteus sp. SC1-56 TaxID=2799565 RepID=UPI00351BF18C